MTTSDKLYDEADQLKEQGDLEAAIAKLQESLQIDETHVLTHSALAVHLQKLGQFDEAIKHASRVVELDPKDSFSYTQLSVIYQRCGKVPEAEAAMDKAHQVRASSGQ